MNFLNYSTIVTASFNKITVFYRDRIIENDPKYIFKGDKYIALIYLQVYSWKINMRFRVRYVIIPETISNYVYK